MADVKQGRGRVDSVDALRGLVMIIMALDHTRDYFHSAAIVFQPDDLTQTTAAIFFTRWITHLCAPTFMFTAGIAAYFRQRGGRGTGELSGFLLKRGLWLVLLEVTVLRFGYSFGVKGPVILTILWALGWSMVALAALVHLPFGAVATISLALIGLHNLTDGWQNESWVWKVAHARGVMDAHGVVVVAGYPLIPWIGVMAAGYCFGRVMEMDAARRRRWMARAGLAMTAAFVAVRGANVYGDPQPWKRLGVMAFLRCTKYPPSLEFLLMTIGPALLLLACFEGVRWGRRNPLIVFGRVPMFYFLVHIFVIHGLEAVFAWTRYGSAGFMWGTMPAREAYPAGYGYSLGVVYLVWAGVVVAMYPACAWFGGVKRRRGWWWLAYL